MTYIRSWYAARNEKKNWEFGPSKFIGYADLSVGEYQKSQEPLDGRITESVLQQWSEPVERGHAIYDELHAALMAFCARHGKKPNSLARIALIKTPDNGAVEKVQDVVLDILEFAVRKLTPAQKSALRKLLDDR
jgi:hypothetical protein